LDDQVQQREARSEIVAVPAQWLARRATPIQRANRLLVVLARRL
jgi:hypothetical protein